jgi:hypothetical protein
VLMWAKLRSRSWWNEAGTEKGKKGVCSSCYKDAEGGTRCDGDGSVSCHLDGSSRMSAAFSRAVFCVCDHGPGVDHGIDVWFRRTL